MDKQSQMKRLAQEMSENAHDIRENAFHADQKSQMRLINHAIKEEQRLLNDLPGTPPITFGIGSNVIVRYLNKDIPVFTATIVAEDVIPFLEFDKDYDKQAHDEYLLSRNGAIVGTPLAVHSPLARAIYGKINGVYNVVVDEEVNTVEVQFA